MSQYDDSLTGTPPVEPTTTPPDYSSYYAQAESSLEDLQLQDELVTQMLAVIEDAGTRIAEGAPDWVDPEVFGGSKRGARMGRQTLRAQDRIARTLDTTRRALAQHHETLSTFRAQVQEVEVQTKEQLDSVRARTQGVTS